MAETLALQDNVPSASRLVSTAYIFCVRIVFLSALHVWNNNKCYL